MNNKQICESKGKDFNKATKRCVKKCNVGEKRNKTFKCRSIHKITKKICDSKNKDFNRFTKKCVQKCNVDKRRYFYCPTKNPTKTKSIHYNAMSLSRRHPCDKSKFGNLKEEDLILDSVMRGKRTYRKIGKNYGTLCRPKCHMYTSKYNIDTNRCRQTKFWAKLKRANRINDTPPNEMTFD